MKTTIAFSPRINIHCNEKQFFVKAIEVFYDISKPLMQHNISNAVELFVSSLAHEWKVAIKLKNNKPEKILIPFLVLLLVPLPFAVHWQRRIRQRKGEKQHHTTQRNPSYQNDDFSLLFNYKFVFFCKVDSILKSQFQGWRLVSLDLFYFNLKLS